MVPHSTVQYSTVQYSKQGIKVLVGPMHMPKALDRGHPVKPT